MTMVPSCLSPMGERAAEQVSERWRVAGTQHGLCGWQGCPLLDWSGQLLSWSSRALLDLVHRPRPPALDLEKFPPDFGAQQWNPGAWLGVGHPVCTLGGWGGSSFQGRTPRPGLGTISISGPYALVPGKEKPQGHGQATLGSTCQRPAGREQAVHRPWAPGPVHVQRGPRCWDAPPSALPAPAQAGCRQRKARP